jgi:ssDNA-binding Zn-finger/Zn-ribbon topoisomerase 1
MIGQLQKKCPDCKSKLIKKVDEDPWTDYWECIACGRCWEEEADNK